MATKQYEYFGNQSPLMNNRYNQARLNAQRTANVKAEQANYVNDPWFTLGSAIGQAWGDRYNERGISKARGEMNDALSGYLGQFAQQPKTDIEKGGVLNNVMPGTVPSDEMLNNNSAQIQGGVLGGLENAIAPMTPQDAYKQYKNDAWVGKYRGDDPNPDSTAITVKNDAQQMNQLADTVDYGKVDKEQAREYVRKQLEQNGRTPYQIEQVLGQFDSIYDSKYGKWKEAKTTDLINNGEQAAKEGRFEDAQNFYMAASQYNPELAKLRLTSLASNMQRKQQNDQFRFAKQIELVKNGLMLDENGNVVRDPSSPIWNQAKFGGVGGRGSRSGNSSGSNGVLSNSVDGANTVAGYGYKAPISEKRFNLNHKILENPEIYGGVNSPAYQRALRENTTDLDGQPGYSVDYDTQRNLACGVRNAIRTGQIKNYDEATQALKSYGFFALPKEDRLAILQEVNMLPIEPADDTDKY